MPEIASTIDSRRMMRSISLQHLRSVAHGLIKDQHFLVVLRLICQGIRTCGHLTSSTTTVCTICIMPSVLAGARIRTSGLPLLLRWTSVPGRTTDPSESPLIMLAGTGSIRTSSSIRPARRSISLLARTGKIYSKFQ